MSYKDWDLTALEAMWKRRARAVQEAKCTITVAGMTRPPRDLEERRFLEEQGRPGPFAKTDTTAAYQRDSALVKDGSSS